MLSKVKDFISSWTNIGNNIFKTDILDAAFYVMLYIVIPIFIAVIDLKNFPTDIAVSSYPYMCIAISAANCLYDIKNRWDSGVATVQNTKLFFMGTFTFVAFAYALFEMFSIAGKQRLDMRCDFILCFYFIPCLISLIDATCCFGKHLLFKDKMELSDIGVSDE